MMKRFEKALCLGIGICVLAAVWQIPFSRNCAQLREDTLRLHIIANSDQEDDQAVKLMVRDAFLADSGDILSGAETRDEAMWNIARNLNDIEKRSAEVLSENGFSYGVKAVIVDMYFEQRTYGDLTLPAGVYKALRIELGEAKGHNWWCIVYPSLCVPSASQENQDTALQDYTEEEREILKRSDDYEYRFLIEDWLQSLFDRQKSQY